MLKIKTTMSTKKSEAHLNAKMTKLRMKVRDAVEYAAQTVKREAKINLTGRFLAVDTGRLRSSVRSQVKVRGSMTARRYYAIVGTNVWYGRLWETGTADGPGGKTVSFTTTRTRPWLSSALETRHQAIIRRLQKAVEAAAKS